jgi:hypothetical protein
MIEKKYRYAAAVVIAAAALGIIGYSTNATRAARESAAVCETVSEEAEEEELLSKEEKALLNKLLKTMNSGKLEKAAELMEEKQDTLAELFYGTMDGQRYLWDGEMLSEEINGDGLVLIKPSAMFYGSFENGMPEGTCQVLQTVNLDFPRYDYSQGTWKAGKMEGEGSTGYCYYKKTPEGEAQSVCKTGTFHGDLMDGDITYESTGGESSEDRFEMTVEKGVIVLDERWSYLEQEKEYQLLSEEDKSHAYYLTEEQAAAEMWKNILVWED